MSVEAFATVVSTHGIRSLRMTAPYFVQVIVNTTHYTPAMYLPAVVDDFGTLVIVGRPL